MLIVLFATLDGYCPICNLDSGLKNTLLSWKIHSEREKVGSGIVYSQCGCSYEDGRRELRAEHVGNK